MQTDKTTNNLFSCAHLSKGIGEYKILEDISFSISKGDKIGLVGPNGSGKSTLMKIVAGIMSRDSGTMNIPKDIKIAYLPQVIEGLSDHSGGEASKKSLSMIISSGANLFLLDEPTNNLDKDGLSHLEGFISRSNNSFVIVSHDRAFLDRMVTRVIEIDPITKSSFCYEGNYSDYAQAKETRIRREWSDYSDKVERLEKLSESVNKKISWVKDIERKRKGNRCLPVQEREKPAPSYLRDKEGAAGRRARMMKDKMAKYKESVEEIKKPSRSLPPQISFSHKRGSTKVFSLKGVTKTIGSKMIGPIDISISYGNRIHIVGANGVGKTTLLKMLVGEILPDSGTIEKGKDVTIGYVPQERWDLVGNKSILEHFISSTGYSENDSRKILGRLGMTASDVFKDISCMSPGEYSRLVIAELVAMKPDCIIMDEPSNHLDLDIIGSLEKGLKEYEGTVIVASHDEYFIKAVGFESVLDMEKT